MWTRHLICRYIRSMEFYIMNNNINGVKTLLDEYSKYGIPDKYDYYEVRIWPISYALEQRINGIKGISEIDIPLLLIELECSVDTGQAYLSY